MIELNQLSYSEVKDKYEALRQFSRETAHKEWPAVLTNKKSQAILKSTLAFSGINVNCISELRKWEMSGSRRVAWDWDKVIKIYRPEPKRFEIAIWHNKHWLCSASIGKTTSSGGKLRLDVIESNPNGSILIGLVADINIKSYKIYADNIGATELRIMNPVNDAIKDYYLSKKGFSYNKKENFCFVEIWKMASKKRKELDLNNPDEVKKAREYAKKIMSEPLDAKSFPDFDERDGFSDVEALLAETEEDRYRQELDEYSPTERREKFKVYTQKKTEDSKK